MRGRHVLLALPLTVCLAAGEPPGPVRLAAVATQPLASRLVLPGTAQARTQTDPGFRRGGKTAVWVFDPARQRADPRPFGVASCDADGGVLVRGGLADGEQVMATGVGQIEPDMALTAWAGATQ